MPNDLICTSEVAVSQSPDPMSCVEHGLKVMEELYLKNVLHKEVVKTFVNSRHPIWSEKETD